MKSKYPDLPIPLGAATIDGMDLAPMPEHGLPEASLTFNLFKNQAGEPSIAVGCVYFVWDTPAPPWPTVAGRLPKCDQRVLDTGLIAVEFDSLGRVSNIEATSYVPGTRWIPETVALSNEEAKKHPQGHHLILSCVATIMRYWPAFEAKWQRGIEATKARIKRPWGILESAKQSKDLW